jgi:hypothetical protein
MLIREATIEDVLKVAETSISRSCAKQQPDVIDHVFALEHEDVVLAVGGLKLLNLSTAWCWFLMTENARDNIVSVYRHIRNWLDELVKLHNLKRLMAAVEIDFEEGQRTVKHLGFVQESVMPCFVGDKAALMFVRLEG